MNKIILSIFITFFLISSVKADEKKEGFYDQITRAVIRLEYTEKVKKEGTNNIETQNVAVGTAFFVASGKDLYVVSARHVVEKNHNLHARVQCKNKITGETEVILLKLSRDRWIFHEDDGDTDTNYVDVAAQKIAWIKDRNIKLFRYEPDTSKNSEKNQLSLEDPTPPKSILAFGFPKDIGFALLAQRPFARAGIIAMTTGKEFLKLRSGKFVEKKGSILDIRMFPGNSGSPVMNKIDFLNTKPKLYGLIIATNTKMDFAIMEPVSRIIEVLDLAKEQSSEELNCWFLLNYETLTSQSTAPDSAAKAASSDR